MSADKKIIWQLAQSWVRSNRVLIWCIAAPYYRYMSCDSNDLTGETQFVAYQVISHLIKNKDLKSSSRYFRVVFRTRCLQMAAGVAINNEIQPHAIMDKKQFIDLDEAIIQKSLVALAQRQRQIAQWILA